jgi:hypothetical protein
MDWERNKLRLYCSFERLGDDDGDCSVLRTEPCKSSLQFLTMETHIGKRMWGDKPLNYEEIQEITRSSIPCKKLKAIKLCLIVHYDDNKFSGPTPLQKDVVKWFCKSFQENKALELILVTMVNDVTNLYAIAEKRTDEKWEAIADTEVEKTFRELEMVQREDVLSLTGTNTAA